MITNIRINKRNLDLSNSSVEYQGQTHNIPYRASRVLQCLLEHLDQPVTRDKLLSTAWPDMLPTDSTLSQSIRNLRLALEDNLRHPDVIKTVPRIGYQLNSHYIESQQTSSPETTSGVFKKLLGQRFRLGLLLVLALTGTLAWVFLQDTPTAIPNTPITADIVNQQQYHGEVDLDRSNSLPDRTELTLLKH